ncbi:hypothetical protein L3Q82_014421 [Scortum barcoo]|uniref:Uncharacterized protein n=1 Tax=Scortum barcoo TaxID=214431 RepID=A0ACB8VWW9_9TELE|nr:hypothetical protein L3Q82_014421 [Scortum barcoo]
MASPAGEEVPRCTENILPASRIAASLTWGIKESVRRAQEQQPGRGATTWEGGLDHFSKAAHFVALPKLPSARETADLTIHVMHLHGIPQDIVSDRGPQFISEVWREFCRGLDTTVSLSSGFNPQTNGQTEHTNQDLESALRCVAAANPSSWSTNLPWIEYSHNSLTSSATGVSPFESSLGYQPPLFSSQEEELAVPSATSSPALSGCVAADPGGSGGDY